jgi:hypothetical protein
MLTSDLDDRVTQLAVHLAHSRPIPLASAERTVRKLVERNSIKSCPSGMFATHHSAPAPQKQAVAHPQLAPAR